MGRIEQEKETVQFMITCQKCPTHCYPSHQREKIRLIMRTIGPRMLFYSPLKAIRHMLKR